MDKILDFTMSAVDYIKGWLNKEKGQGFRISIQKKGCSGYKYTPSIVAEAVPGDIHFIHQPDLQVYVDPLCLEHVKGLTVDYVEEKQEGSLKQKHLVFINPNEKSRCGCGESFYV